MWTVIYMAQNKDAVDKLRRLLESYDIIVKIRPIDKSGEDDCCYEVLVPDSEVSQAHEILIDAQL